MKVQVLQVLLAGLLLAGCAGKVEPQIRTVRVEVPVQVPCRVPEVAVPTWAAVGLKKGDSLEVKVRALLAERRQRIGYERQLLAAVISCS
ncbi:MAG: lipoprotein [Pseudomonas orientalis]|nr:lipoprotein [Pseudomonas orientalis]